MGTGKEQVLFLSFHFVCPVLLYSHLFSFLFYLVQVADQFVPSVKYWRKSLRVVFLSPCRCLLFSNILAFASGFFILLSPHVFFCLSLSLSLSIPCKLYPKQKENTTTPIKDEKMTTTSTYWRPIYGAHLLVVFSFLVVGDWVLYFCLFCLEHFFNFVFRVSFCLSFEEFLIHNHCKLCFSLISILHY